MEIVSNISLYIYGVGRNGRYLIEKEGYQSKIVGFLNENMVGDSLDRFDVKGENENVDTTF